MKNISFSQNLDKLLTKCSIPTDGDKVIVFLKTNECINCYKPVNLFFDNLFKSGFPNVYVVLEGMNEKQGVLFIKKNFETDLKFRKTICDDELFKLYGHKTFTSALYLKGVKIIKQQLIKDDWNFEIKKFDNKTSELSVDSIDISNFIIGNDIPIAPLKYNKVAIFDRLQDLIFTYNYKTRKTCDTINIFDYLLNSFDQNFMFIYKDSIKLKFNNDISKKDKLLKQKIQIVNINTYDDFIYVGYRLVVKENHAKKGITVTTNPVFCKLNSNLKPVSFYYLKSTLEDGKTCTDVLFSDIIDSNHVKIQFTNSKRYKDTLCGIFRLENNSFMSLEKCLLTKIPPILPKSDPVNKLPNFYKVNLISYNDLDGFYFWQCPEIFLSKNKTNIIFDSLRFNRNERITDFYTILNNNKNNLLILKSSNKNQLLFQYDYVNKIKSKEILLANYNFNDFKFIEDKLICIKSWPSSTKLYIFTPQVN